MSDFEVVKMRANKEAANQEATTTLRVGAAAGVTVGALPSFGGANADANYCQNRQHRLEQCYSQCQ
jgi:hypothetical protein